MGSYLFFFAGSDVNFFNVRDCDLSLLTSFLERSLYYAPFLSISLLFLLLLLLLLRPRFICFMCTFLFPTCGMSPEHKRFFFFNIINFYISNFGFLYVQHIPYIKLVNYDEQK